MSCRIYKLDFQEKNLNLDRDLNHGAFGVYRFKMNICAWAGMGTWIAQWLRAPG